MKLSAPLIYGLIACILLVSAPHAAHLPLWVSLSSLSLLAWRAYLTYSGKKLPSRWLLVLVTLACVAGITLSLHSLFGREVGVTLLILLGSLKLLELREIRDATILLYLCCFVIITNFFYSQSFVTALLMLFDLLVIMATWLHLQTGELGLRPRLRIASVILLQAVPLALLIFVFFPRVQGPLWGMPQDAYGSSGLSDSMSPGSMSKLTLSDAVAFRVTFNGQAPSREQMYWRGPVLWDFDGSTWTRGHNLLAQPARLDKVRQPVRYTVTLEPHNKPWLFALDMPVNISIPAVFSPDFNLLNKTPVNARLRYNATSLTSYLANLDESPQQIQRALALPTGYNPRVRKLAAEWRAQNPDHEAIVKTALAYFNRGGFEYTLEPPPLGRNSVDDFLFETRKGFCEYYASSFVFLMRAAGIPARVVTGYQGGEYNDLGGYYVLRQADAHAWTEVWLEDRGWVRYDPTAAIAPGRIQNGLSASLPDNAALPFFTRTRSSLLLKLRLDLDALTNQWNQWVLGYDTERQFALLTRLGMSDITWQKLVLDMSIGMALLTGVFLLFMLRRLQRPAADKTQELYLKFCQKLARAGIARAEHEGAQDFAQRAARHKPQHASTITDITEQYLALRYRNRLDANALLAFKRAVRGFKL
jgi:transglutaminase-like putative cysteine protease